MNSRGRTQSGGLRLGGRGSNSLSRGSRGPLQGPSRGGPQRGGPTRGGQPHGGLRGGMLGRGGYPRMERPQYDDYGYNDGYQGGYGRGPQGGLMPPPPMPHEWEMGHGMLMAQQGMLGEQQAWLDRQAHTYTAFGPEQRGFKRPAYPPGPLGPPHPKRFPPAPPAFRPAAPGSAPPFRPPRANRSLTIFRGPQAMSSGVKARIHSVVGLVVREMRAPLNAHPRIPAGNWQMNKIRRTIRDRIYELLMHKPIGTNEEILAMYRASYPKSDDGALVTTVKESMDEDVYAKYMGENLGPVVRATLEDMFAKISKLYDEELKQNASEVPRDVEMSEAPETVEEISKQGTVPEATESDKAAVTIQPEMTAVEAATKDGESKDASKLDMKNHDEESLKDMLEYMLKKSLPKVLPLFKHAMVQIMCKGGRFTYNVVEEVEESKMKNGEGNHENGSGDTKENEETLDAVGESDIKNDADEMEELLTLIKDTTAAGDKADDVTVEEEKMDEEKGEEEKVDVKTEEGKVNPKAAKPTAPKTTDTPSRVNTRRSSRLPKN